MVSAEGDVVCEGDHVVLDVNNGERLVVTQVTRKTKVKLSKRGYASVMPLLGKAYGTIFEVSVDGKCLEVGTEEKIYGAARNVFVHTRAQVPVIFLAEVSKAVFDVIS